MAVVDWLQQLGQGSEADAEVFTDVLMAIPDRRTLVGGPLRSILLQQAVAKNYQLRQAARQLLVEAAVALPVPVSTPLPAAYSLHIAVAQRKRLEQPDEELPLSSPRDLVQPYEYLLDRLAGQAGLTSGALYYRTAALMEETASPCVLTEQDDRELVKQLEAISLTYASISLRIAAARRAVMHLVTELLDAGRLTERWAARNLPLRDYLPDGFPEVPKPAFIHTLKRHQANHVAGDWVETVSSGNLLQQPGLSVYQPGWLVIGEYSLVRSLYWGTATETYKMHLTGRQPAEEEDFLSVAFNQLTAAYYSLDEVDLDLLIIRHCHFLQHTFKSQWLAFNPALARHLGWQPAPGKLFGWQDQANNLLIKSVYWVNGNIDMPPPRLESEAGEGWLVLASPDALAQLQQLGQPLFSEKQLTRSQWRQEEQKRVEQSATAWFTYPHLRLDNGSPGPDPYL